MDLAALTPEAQAALRQFTINVQAPALSPQQHQQHQQHQQQQQQQEALHPGLLTLLRMAPQLQQQQHQLLQQQLSPLLQLQQQQQQQQPQPQQQQSVPIDPILLPQPAQPVGPNPVPDLHQQRMQALEDKVRLLEEKIDRANDADDEGNGGALLHRRSRAAGFELAVQKRLLSDLQKEIRGDVTRRIRQVMKSLTKRGGGDEDELDTETLPGDEPGIVPDFDKPLRFSANENLIARTVELVAQEYKDCDPVTGHFISEGVVFTRKDIRHFATSTFENKKRGHTIQKDKEKRRKAERARRENKRRGRQRHTKETRKFFIQAYQEKYGVELPKECFQTDFMTELVSDVDSTDIPDPSENEEDEDEHADESESRALRVESRRKAHVKAKKMKHYLKLAEEARLTRQEIKQKVKVWEEKKPAYRSKKLSRIFKRIDKLAAYKRDKEDEDLRRVARRVAMGHAKYSFPRCKGRVWPFMVDKNWLANDDDGTKSQWRRLQLENPSDLDLRLNSNSDADSSVSESEFSPAAIAANSSESTAVPATSSSSDPMSEN